MRLTELTSETAALWFHAIGTEPAADDVARMGAALSGGALHPNLRQVAANAEGPIGRFAAQRRETVIRFWMPSFRPGVDPAEKRAVMAAFIADLAARRVGLPLEVPTGEDEEDHALWMEVLAASGSREVSCYRLHVLEAARFPKIPRPLPGFAIREWRAADNAELVRVFRLAYAETRERRDRNPAQAEQYLKAAAQIGEGRESKLWLMGMLDAEPAGFVLVNRAREEPFPGLSAWILEVGAMPAIRGRGVARALMSEALARIISAGCERVLATIDEQNTPSLRLHAAFGFVPQKDRHYVLRIGG